MEGREAAHPPVPPRTQEIKSTDGRGNADRDKFDQPASLAGVLSSYGLRNLTRNKAMGLLD